MNCDPASFPAVRFDADKGKYVVDHAALRGANYFSIGANPRVFWRDFDLARIGGELDLAKAAGVNSLRVWLSYESYSVDPLIYLSQLDQFLAAACSRGIVLLVVVTDFCFGWNGTQAFERWAGTPGIFFMGSLGNHAPYLAHVDAVLLIVQQYPTYLVMFDLSNEPTSNPWTRKDPLGGVIPAVSAPVAGGVVAFLIAVLTRLFERASEHEITIGEGLQALFSSSQFLRSYPFTFQSLHGGYNDAETIREMMAGGVASSKVPVVLTETAADPDVIPYAVRYADEYRVGFMFWGLMKGFNQWNSWTGLLFPDARTTSLAAIEALTGAPPDGWIEAPQVPPGFEVMNEKAQIRLALERLAGFPVVDASNADETRTLPWELLFWGFFLEMPRVHQDLLGLHLEIEAANAAGDTALAYQQIKAMVDLAHDVTSSANFRWNPTLPHSKFGPPT
jgi:hypothetical protein